MSDTWKRHFKFLIAPVFGSMLLVQVFLAPVPGKYSLLKIEPDGQWANHFWTSYNGWDGRICSPGVSYTSQIYFDVEKGAEPYVNVYPMGLIIIHLPKDTKDKILEGNTELVFKEK